MVVDEFPQAQVPGEGGRKEQASIGHQAAVVKDDADTVGIVAWQHLLGDPCFRAVFCSKTIIPDSQEHPLLLQRLSPRPSFGGFGLSIISFQIVRNSYTPPLSPHSFRWLQLSRPDSFYGDACAPRL